MELVWDIMYFVCFVWFLAVLYSQGKLLKLRAQIIEHLEHQVDRCAYLARNVNNSQQVVFNHPKDAPVVRMVYYALCDVHAARKQRDHLMKLVEEYKARYEVGGLP